jgi:hypothetical protein
MDKLTLDKLCQQVYRQFPVVKGKRPIVSKQGGDRYLLVFSTTEKTPGGQSFQQNIRVVADQSGRIIKSTMSK